MGLLQTITRWLDIRPNEVRSVTLSFVGAFLVLAFLILARALREALYLAAFDVETLPYITAAVAILSVPTVGLFTRLLSRHQPQSVLMAAMLVIATGLAALWPLATRAGAAVVAFYLWTALGTLLLASGFWVVTAEYFPVRGAKRLFGLIGAGGTAGAVVMGSSLLFLATKIELSWLIPLLIVLLVLFFAAQSLLPKLSDTTTAARVGQERSSSIRESLGLVWGEPHLRTIALIVFAANIASVLLDYQFKEFAQARLVTGEQLASFFGAFYGWTGLVALILQLVFAARLMSTAGIALTVAVLPSFLLLGSVGLLIVPSLVLATLVRGGDYSIRKSIYRSVLEVMYVPVPTALRRKTKTFIDSLLDAVGDGTGAGLVFLWVTLSGFPSRYLSVYLILFAAFLLYLSQRMGKEYFTTVTEQLKAGGEESGEKASEARLAGRDLLSATVTRLDLRTLVGEGDSSEAEETRQVEGAPATPADLLGQLRSSDPGTVARALEETSDWDESHVPALARLLARDALFDRVLFALLSLAEQAVPQLTQLLGDEATDFTIRRRVPRVLARMGGEEADGSLLDALSANRFEVRYRSAIALVRRRRKGLPRSPRDPEPIVWEAIRAEVGRGRAVWELQNLLDGQETEDDLVAERIDVRGELGLEHTFRLLTLVLDPEPVRAAFHGVILDDEGLKSFALEYLEQVLPPDVREKLWPFIGDVSEHKRDKALRPINQVVADLMTGGRSLFIEEHEREALKRLAREPEEK